MRIGADWDIEQICVTTNQKKKNKYLEKKKKNFLFTANKQQSNWPKKKNV